MTSARRLDGPVAVNQYTLRTYSGRFPKTDVILGLHLSRNGTRHLSGVHIS